MIYYTPMAQMGRPKTYDEPTLKRHFDLPQSVNDMLKSMAKRDNKPDVRVVQDAIAFLFSGGKSSSREVAREESPNAGGVHLNFPDEDVKKLTATAKRYGFNSPEHLVKAIVQNAALSGKAETLEGLLFGSLIKSAEEQVKRDMAAKVKPKRKEAA